MMNKMFVLPALVLLLGGFVVAMDNPCDLPSDLQLEISSKYPGKKVVTLSDLDEYDRGLFQKDHGNACPGLTKVDFYGDGSPTLVVVLIANKGAKSTAELVIAHRLGNTWKIGLLDTAKNSVPVVWKQDPGEYQDVNGEKKLRAAHPVVVFCGYEAWAILYAWTDNHVAKIWLSD